METSSIGFWRFASKTSPVVRFANRLFESVWNREHVAAVDIVWDETVALEGRAGETEPAMLTYRAGWHGPDRVHLQ